MFDFIEDIKELKNSIVGYRYINYGGEVAIVQGYKDILFFDENSVILKLKSGELLVKGQGLVVTEFTTNSVKICGKIISIEKAGK